MHTPFPMAVRSIIQDLLHSYADAGGIEENLRKVRERLGSRGILSVRRAEIELIKAGKVRYAEYGTFFIDIRANRCIRVVWTRCGTMTNTSRTSGDTAT